MWPTPWAMCHGGARCWQWEGLELRVLLTKGGAVRWFQVRRPEALATDRQKAPHLEHLELAAALLVAVAHRAAWQWRWRCCPRLAARSLAGLAGPRRGPVVAANRQAWRCCAKPCSPAPRRRDGRAAGLAVCAPAGWWAPFGGCSSPCTPTAAWRPHWPAAGVLALALFLALYYAAVCALFKHFSFTHRAVNALFFAACWLLAELARGVLWTGFPWGASGYAHISGLLFPLARWVGVYGIGAAAAGLAMLLAQCAAATCATRKSGPCAAMAPCCCLACMPSASSHLNNYRTTSRPCRWPCCKAILPRMKNFKPAPAFRWRCSGTAASCTPARPI